jgi:hypothetical protein
MYGEFMLGSNAPITERDLTPEMLSVMRKQYEDRRVADMATTARLRGMLDETPEQYAKNPEIDPVARELGMDGVIPYEQAMAKARAELARYKPGRTAITKYDPRYTNLDYAGMDLADPGYQVATTLGRYVVQETPEGPVALDTYDFGNIADESIMNARGLVGKLNALANIVRPGASRPVRIKMNGRK